MHYTYSRVSTNKQQSSTDQQEELLKKFCSAKGFVEVIHLVDIDVSGGKPILERPAGQQLKNLKKGDVVIAWKKERMFRSTLDALTTVYAWLDLGISIYFIESGSDPLTLDRPDTKFTFTILCATAELEKDTTRLRIIQNFAYRKKNGKTCSPPQYGWDNIDGNVVQNEKEQEILSLIKEYKAQGMTLKEIAAQLNEAGYKAKKGGLWQFSVIKKILDNQINN
jgi:site-specific DNA recombinase